MSVLAAGASVSRRFGRSRSRRPSEKAFSFDDERHQKREVVPPPRLLAGEPRARDRAAALDLRRPARETRRCFAPGPRLPVPPRSLSRDQGAPSPPPVPRLERSPDTTPCSAANPLEQRAAKGNLAVLRIGTQAAVAPPVVFVLARRSTKLIPASPPRGHQVVVGIPGPRRDSPVRWISTHSACDGGP